MCPASVSSPMANFSHFQLFQNKDLYSRILYKSLFRTTACPATKIHHNCSSSGPEKVLYLLEAIRNPRGLGFFVRRSVVFQSNNIQHALPITVSPLKSYLYKIQQAATFLTLFSQTTSYEVALLTINIPLILSM